MSHTTQWPLATPPTNRLLLGDQSALIKGAAPASKHMIGTSVERSYNRTRPLFSATKSWGQSAKVFKWNGLIMMPRESMYLCRILLMPFNTHSRWPQRELWPHLTSIEVPDASYMIISHTCQEGRVGRVKGQIIDEACVARQGLKVNN